MLDRDFLSHIQPVVNKIRNCGYSIWIFILYRLFNRFIVRTYFFADEYFQSIEVAHYWVFGYGHLTWEWEPCIALRSVLHPFFFAILFYILKILHLDYPILVLYVPKIFQAVCAAFCDLGVLKMITLWYDHLYKTDSKHDSELICNILVYHLLCWFHFFTICRTSSNAFECVLVVWGVYFLSKNYSPIRTKNKASREILDLTKSNMKGRDSAENCTEDTTKESEKEQFLVDKSEGILLTELKQNSTSDKVGIRKRKEGIEMDQTYNSSSTEVTETNRSNFDVVDESKMLREQIPKCTDNEFLNQKEIKSQHIQNLLCSFICSSLCSVIKPNSVVFWLAIYFFYVLKSFNKDSTLSFKEVIKIGMTYVVLFILASTAIDSYYYGHITFTFYNFFQFNMLGEASTYFGASPFYYYITHTLCLIYLTFVPFTLYSVVYAFTCLTKKDIRCQDVLSRIDVGCFIALFCELVALSVSKHKEQKMMTGYVPCFTILTILFLNKFRLYLENSHGEEEKDNDNNKIENKKMDKTSMDTEDKDNSDVHNESEDRSKNQSQTLTPNERRSRNRKYFNIFVNIHFVVQILSIILSSFFIQGAPEKISTYFRNLKLDNTTTKDEDISLFSLSCYDFPLYSHIHRKYKIGFLDCSPVVKDGVPLKHWRQIIYDENFGSTFYNLFDKTQSSTPNYIEPYIFPEHGVHWFGSTHFNSRKNFHFGFRKIDFSCLYYRIFTPLHGELPDYIITDSSKLKALASFFNQFNYRLVGKPFFHNLELEEVEGKKKFFINSMHIFKKE